MNKPYRVWLINIEGPDIREEIDRLEDAGPTVARLYVPGVIDWCVEKLDDTGSYSDNCDCREWRESTGEEVEQWLKK
jgi:hypothetical protein